MYVLDVKNINIVDFSTVPDDVTSLTIKGNHQKLFFNTPFPNKIDKLHIYHCRDIDFSSERFFHDNVKELCLNISEPLNEKFLNEIAQSKVVTFGYSCCFEFDVKYLPKYVIGIIHYNNEYYSGDFPFEKIKTVAFEQRKISCLKNFVNAQCFTGKVVIDSDNFEFPELKIVKLICYSNTSFPKLMTSVKKCVNLIELTIVVDDDRSIGRGRFEMTEYEFDLSDTKIKKMFFIHEGITTVLGDGEPLKKRIVFISRPKFSENLKKLKLHNWWNRSTLTYEEIPLVDLPVSLIELSIISSKTDLDFSRFVNMKNLNITFKIERKTPIISRVIKKSKFDIDIDDMFNRSEEYHLSEDCLIKVYPPNLEKLSIMVDGFKLSQFPDTLKELCIVGCYCQIQKLPSRLTRLELDIDPEMRDNSNHKIVFPQNLTHLITHDFFYDGESLPLSLLSLEIKRLCNNDILRCLKNLKNLHILKIESYIKMYRTQNKNIEFPESLRILHIQRAYDSIIPPFIEELYYE